MRLMSSGFRKNFEEYARRCVELSRHADTETRARLLRMARDYMRAAMEEEVANGLGRLNGSGRSASNKTREPQPARIRQFLQRMNGTG
jgi:hypothetical protein